MSGLLKNRISCGYYRYYIRNVFLVLFGSLASLVIKLIDSSKILIVVQIKFCTSMAQKSGLAKFLVSLALLSNHFQLEHTLSGAINARAVRLTLQVSIIPFFPPP